MSLGNIFDIAGSGMTAQSLRLNTTASNIANAETASSSTDTTYRARKPVFSAIQQSMMNPGQQGFGVQAGEDAGAGVRVEGIVESDAELQMRYEPHHPAANEDGYVFYPNVNVVEEMADMMSSSRSFQMNVDIMNTAKSMMQRILTLGQQ
ncbi:MULTISPECIES: flagellar basal body rod protein FlgC [Marinobacter]|uniref:Flagellar basal-body rod protein FlgC n=1 Tax=Marinobacter xiaoshiensis TaxID=3073652 RepID=A0ABU2HG50_9GAMM|nr:MULTISPECIES: flagellar basal body rod protein FlgC [unclassified Marinobacter]MBK1874885.1 flagellar basal body rod protein FlgC [Marinobacter sp. 1-3A]MBK1887664.1 flagellar basal body rod protein FlgC [Marinobacter sp. DY40_1A1]MDS1310059.1 flagellar basal body rod protein FlgC [Marinobacter sp. F60267]